MMAVIDSVTCVAPVVIIDTVKNPVRKIDVFEVAGLTTFFEGNDDGNVDWLEVFDVKS